MPQFIILRWDQAFERTDQAHVEQINVNLKAIFIQISRTPGQVATDVCQALEYSTWKAHVHINQRIPTPVSKELLSEDILRMAHTVHSVPLSIFRAQGPPDSLLSSCDPPFWCHGFYAMGIFRFNFATFVEITPVSQFLLILQKSHQFLSSL